MNPSPDPAACCPPLPRDPAQERQALRDWWRIGLGTLLAGYAMSFSLAINTAEASATTRTAVHTGLLIVAVILWATLGGPLLRRAFQAARARRVTVEALFLAGLLGASGASLQGMLAGDGPVYFETVAVLLVVYSLGRRLTQSSQERALASVASWLGIPESCERLAPGGTSRACPVREIAAGDLVRVQPGRMIPVDGIVAAGAAFVQQAHVTGESSLARRGPGDAVAAGAVCVDATLTVRATAPGNARRIDRIARAIDQARARPSAFVTAADRMARLFLPLVLAIALLTFLVWTRLAGWPTGLFNMLAVLLIACPCALGFATPAAVWSAIGRIAEHGLVARAGSLIERLAAVDLVIFDKTGTLTLPRPQLADLVLADASPGTHRRWRALIAAAERASDHPLAEALASLAPAADAPADAIADAVRVDALRIIPGLGIEADVTWRADGETGSGCLRIGSEGIVGADQKAPWRELSDRLQAGDLTQRIAVLLDGRPIATAAIDERPMPSMQPALELTRALGPRLMVLTGDTADRAARLGIAEYEAALTPEAKLARVRELRAAGRTVLFVGDGLNDAAAMAEADAAIAVAGAAPLARESADALLTDDDLAAIPRAIDLARRAARVIQSNIRLAVAYNLAGMAVAAAGWLHPVAAALIMTCSSLIVTWRSLRALHDEPGAAPVKNPAPEARHAVLPAP